MTITPSLFGLNSPGAVNTFVTNPTDAFDASAFFATDELRVASSHLPGAQQHVEYSFQMIGWGGVGPPYSWTGGGFPAGIGIGSGGEVGGCPVAPIGYYQPAAQVFDSAGNSSLLTPLDISVAGAPSYPKISTSVLPPAPVNQPYSAQVIVTGGLPDFGWFASGLPSWLTIVGGGPGTSYATIMGTPPTQANGHTYTFTVTVTDSECPGGYGTDT